MAQIILGILLPCAIFAVVLVVGICRRPNIRAGIKIPFANFTFESSDQQSLDVPETTAVKKD